MRRRVLSAAGALLLAQHVYLSARPWGARAGPFFSFLHLLLFLARQLPVSVAAWALRRVLGGQWPGGRLLGRNGGLWRDVFMRIVEYLCVISTPGAMRAHLRLAGFVQRRLVSKGRRYARTIKCAGIPCTWTCLGLGGMDARNRPQDCNVLLYFHGGGYGVGCPDMYLLPYIRMLELVSIRSGEPWGVLSVDYALAPEAPFPGAIDEAMAVYRWCLFNCARSIVVAGDSAGGNLAVCTALQAKAHELATPTGLVLISPWVDLTADGRVPWADEARRGVRDYLHDSFAERCANNYVRFSSTAAVSRIKQDSKADPARGKTLVPLVENRAALTAAHPLVSVARNPDLKSLPRTLVLCGGAENLRQSILAFVKRVGDKARLVQEPGEVHIYPLFYPLLPGDQGLRSIADFLVDVSESRPAQAGAGRE